LYIVVFIIVLCIDLFSCKAASLFTINLLTYLLTYYAFTQMLRV